MGNRSDNFNRGDTPSAIGTPSDAGSDWVTLSGQWGISSNTAYESIGNTDVCCVLESSLTNVAIQVTLSTFQVQQAIVLRVIDDNNYLLAISEATGLAQIYKRVAGTFTQLATAAASFSNGDVFKVTVDSANLITFYKNGSPLGLSLTDATHSTATKHGIRMYSSTVARFDDFSITALDAITGLRPAICL